MDCVFLVKVKEINDDVLAKLLDFGSIDMASEVFNVCAVTTDESNRRFIMDIPEVITVEKDVLFNMK